MERSQKVAVVDSFKSTISKAQSVVLTEFSGLTVVEAAELRAQLREAGVGFRVIKNTLAKRAIEGTDLEVLTDSLTGPTAWAYSDEDPVSPAKILTDFLKGVVADHMTIKRGFLGGKALSPEQVTALAKMPSKDELRSKLLSVFNGTATQFVRVLSARPTEFLTLLTARKEDIE